MLNLVFPLMTAVRNSFKFGFSSNPAADQFTGFLDEVRIYLRDLSAREIQIIYANNVGAL